MATTVRRKEFSFLQKLVSLGICVSNEVVLLMKIGYFKTWFFTNCDKMLNFVHFHRRILGIMLRVLSNLLMYYLTYLSTYVVM